MSLQRRLTLFFVLIVILPLAVAAFVVQGVVASEIEQRALLSVGPTLDATVALYNDRAEAVEDRVRAVVSSANFSRLLQRDRQEAIKSFLANRVSTSASLDFVALVDADGDIISSVADAPRFLPGFSSPSLDNIVDERAGAARGFYRSSDIPLVIPGRGQVATAIGGFWIDESLLIGSQHNVTLGVFVGDRIVSSTGQLERAREVDVSLGGAFEVDIGDGGQAQARAIDESVGFLAWTSAAPAANVSRQLLLPMLGFLAVALAVTGVLAYLLARLITQPLGELSEGARAISEGRFDYRIPVRSRDEVGQLAIAFNEMTERLRATVTELSESRDQLQRAVRRVGETLRSTHDMKQIHQSVLDTAVDAVIADAGALWMFTPTRDEIYPAISRGIESDDLDRLRVGAGIVGLVAERGTTVLLPDDRSALMPVPGEPAFPVAIAIPLHSGARIAGVLSIYRHDEDRAFTQKDLDTVVFLAEQGGVAIENVQLHEEAQRLSLTDGLTGVWNRRYFQMQFRQVMATAARFNRPFSILMMDLDRFKEINDTYGHQRGDAILIEFAQRVKRTLREVDTFARYGGEEFVCLLPETDAHGALITAEKIIEETRSNRFGGAGEDGVRMTVSVGLSSYPDHGDSFRGIIASADQALYRAKQEGRDRVCMAQGPEGPGLKLAT